LNSSAQKEHFLSDKHLIIVTGPVGGGKSTTAAHVAIYLREFQLATAVIDSDVVYSMVRQHPDFGDQNIWSATRRATAALVESFYASGLNAVVVDGAFWSEREYSELKSHFVSEVQETFVTLMVSDHEALRRAQTDSDPNRGVSRLPEVQVSLYAAFSAGLAFLEQNSKVIHTDHEQSEAVAKQIAQMVIAKLK
jgi:shikimate kinase